MAQTMELTERIIMVPCNYNFNSAQHCNFSSLEGSGKVDYTFTRSDIRSLPMKSLQNLYTAIIVLQRDQGKQSSIPLQGTEYDIETQQGGNLHCNFSSLQGPRKVSYTFRKQDRPKAPFSVLSGELKLQCKLRRRRSLLATIQLTFLDSSRKLKLQCKRWLKVRLQVITLQRWGRRQRPIICIASLCCM